MKIYKSTTVYEEAKERIRYLFDEFEDVIIGVSGGKDSTVVYNLALEVAREKNKLPIKVLFIDQEAEWDSVISYMRTIMNNKDVIPLWLQVPIKLFNATSSTEQWLYCWEEGKEWIREKEPNSIKENTFGTDRFAELFTKFLEKEYKDKKICYLAGVRAEESPTRYTTLTSTAKYKHITYGKGLNKKLGHYTFYPIYDWSYKDVWKYIHDNNIEYCKIYDYMYQHGVPAKDMRVSNVHHETAVKSLYFLQEIEADLWNRLVVRLKGINTAGQLKGNSFNCPKELPFMFKDWKEYRDHLLENIISDPEVREKFKKKFAELDEKYKELNHIETLHRVQITALLANDFEFTKLKNFERSPDIHNFRNYNKGIYHRSNKKNKYIKDNNL